LENGLFGNDASGGPKAYDVKPLRAVLKVDAELPWGYLSAVNILQAISQHVVEANVNYFCFR
jgi:hypothetical protein